MDKVLEKLVFFGVLIYLYDALLYVDDPENSIELLRKVLKLLIAARI